ncbi:conserved protein of unknown function (plasmid) [Paraburkholderia kururiensis]|uniref:hypothetical protein n=1 Tax=Paraburkholderia kururiensis TaxID=984307 RepID=UPI0039A5A9FA
MGSRNPIDVSASRYGRRWMIGIFIVWLIAFELFNGRVYGWSAHATNHDIIRSAIVLIIGCAIALAGGKRAEARYRRSRQITF